MSKRYPFAGRVMGVIATLLFLCTSSAHAETFDFEGGNAATDVVIPTAVPAILETIGHGDASLILRYTAMTTNSWFDAIAPYHPTAVGVYSSLGRRPSSERATHRERNIAMFYASYRVLSSVLPQHAARWTEMLRNVGLDPNDNSKDLRTPVGIGNVAGKAIAAAREHDGMNQLGDEGGRVYNLEPYSDYLGYEPVNTPFELEHPGRWQPNIVTAGNGIFRVQKFVTPQMRVTRPYSYKDPNRYRVPPPSASDPRNFTAYKAQVDNVLAESAGLTDYKKMIAELFDHKFASLALSGFFATQQAKLPLDETIHYEFLLNFSAFDGAIIAWNQKHHWDAVRPFSAIRYIYGDKTVKAWGGPGKGTVSDITGNEWKSYLPTADHPDYPSGSACFCGIHAEVSRKFFGSDELGWTVVAKKGSSVREPGFTPAADVTMTFPTYTDFERECQNSRVWGGVHFRPAVVEGGKLCRRLGTPAYDFLRAHIEGRGAKK
jgi:hypothetical protein